MSKPINTNDLRDYADRISNPYSQFILDAASELDATRTERNILREAVNVFVRCSFPADTSIDPRGYGWCEGWLDEALVIARDALKSGEA